MWRNEEKEALRILNVWRGITRMNAFVFIFGFFCFLGIVAIAIFHSKGGKELVFTLLSSVPLLGFSIYFYFDFLNSLRRKKLLEKIVESFVRMRKDMGNDEFYLKSIMNSYEKLRK